MIYITAHAAQRETDEVEAFEIPVNTFMRARSIPESRVGEIHVFVSNANTLVQEYNRLDIGYLRWSLTDGMIEAVRVNPEFRRLGVATAMLRRAKEYASARVGLAIPCHSSNRTPSGDAWARSTGDPLP